MDFGILGPVTAHRDGTAIPLRGRHSPRLLARLLIDAGRVVTVEQLEDVLWTDDRPTTARRQVQNAMAALRRVLDTTAVTVEREGYRLGLERNTVDAQRFTELIALARARTERGESVAALRDYREALALWRGPALADRSEPDFVTAAAQLNETRFAAVEAWAGLELESGTPTDIIDTLTDFLARQPLRQNLANLLMRALHDAGRTGEALAVYTDIRSRLATELGLDPQPELTELHHRLRRSHAVAMPPPPETVDDRAGELAALDALLPDGGIAVVSGVDPTVPVLHWADRHREHFPDGWSYVDLNGSHPEAALSTAAVLRRLLDALGHPAEAPDDVDDAAALYRSLLTGRRTLLVLADARDAEQVRLLLPGSATNLAIVTSRQPLTSLVVLDDALAVRLG